MGKAEKDYVKKVEASAKKRDKRLEKIQAEYDATVKAPRTKYVEARDRWDRKIDRLTRPLERKKNAALKPLEEDLYAIRKTAKAMFDSAKRKVQQEHRDVKKKAEAKFRATKKGTMPFGELTHPPYVD